MVNKTFDKISNEFSSTVNQTKEFIRLPMFLRLVGDIRNKSVADFGCGDGFFTRILAQNFPSEVVGIDYSEPMIKKAIEKENANTLEIK
ncbi:MAG: class I SAM-dependent methyltransferase [Nanoarchaeota archaeon]